MSWLIVTFLACIVFVDTIRCETNGRTIRIVDFHAALTHTHEFQQEADELRERYESYETEIRSQRTEVEELRKRLKSGQHLLSEQALRELMHEIDRKSRVLRRTVEDASADLRRDELRIAREIGERLLAVIATFARQEGIALVISHSGTANAVVYAAEGIDVTNEIVQMYDLVHCPECESETGSETKQE